MRFNEFEKDALRQLAERRDISEEQLDEILPAIAAGVGAAARVGAGLAARGAAAAGRAAAKGAAALGKAAVRGVGRAAVGAAGRAAAGAGRAASAAGRGVARGAAKSIGGRDNEEPETNDPNSAVGTQGSQGTQGTSSTQTVATKAISNKLKPGKTLKLPSRTASGKPGPAKNFKISRVKGDEIEIQNPVPTPGEPQKFVYNKSDLEGVLSNEVK